MSDSAWVSTSSVKNTFLRDSILISGCSLALIVLLSSSPSSNVPSELENSRLFQSALPCSEPGAKPAVLGTSVPSRVYGVTLRKYCSDGFDQSNEMLVSERMWEQSVQNPTLCRSQ